MTEPQNVVAMDGEGWPAERLPWNLEAEKALLGAIFIANRVAGQGLSQ